MLLNESLKNLRVLVIGDSFTDILDTHYTWLNRLRIHYNWSIDNLSIPGTGSFYAWHTFLNYNKEFDLCIFAWSEPSRFYHESVPCLNSSEVKLKQKMSPWMKDIYRAGQLYYMHLCNWEHKDLENIAMLYWLDNQLIEKYKDKKFIHFHSFPYVKEPIAINVYEYIKTKNEDMFYHTFKTGINVGPTLVKISSNDPDAPTDYAFDHRPGHLSKHLHDKLFYSLVDYFKKNSYTNGDTIRIM